MSCVSLIFLMGHGFLLVELCSCFRRMIGAWLFIKCSLFSMRMLKYLNVMR